MDSFNHSTTSGLHFDHGAAARRGEHEDEERGRFIPDFGYRLSRISGIGYRISGIGYRISGIGYSGFRVSGIPVIVIFIVIVIVIVIVIPDFRYRLSRISGIGYSGYRYRYRYRYGIVSIFSSRLVSRHIDYNREQSQIEWRQRKKASK